MCGDDLAALAENLAETAAALQEVDAELSSELARAAEALGNGDVAAAQQALREAAGTLQQRAQAQAAAQQAAAAAGQLSQGRAEVAQAGQPVGSGGSQPGQGQGQDDGPAVFVPEFADLSGVKGVGVQLPAECVANPENCGALITEEATEFGAEESLVPYDQVFGDYRNAAYQALEDDYVPLGLKSTIRDYFSSLEP
jgi:multidrug efflux pump subunit AcrA (membrane-fusion protein)